MTVEIYFSRGNLKEEAGPWDRIGTNLLKGLPGKSNHKPFFKFY